MQRKINLMSHQPVDFDTFYRSIWLKIPEVYRNVDAQNGRPLQILTLTMAQQFYYYFYLKINSMDELFDPELCPKEYLAFLSSMIGWKLVGTDENSWRQQIKHAPLLYKIKGTQKSIVLAEKLIGFSVYISELYRDYTGLIVPKEKIFNTFPLSIKIKPWFRKTSIDTEKHIITDAFSDLFPSFNEGTSTITSLGELIHPKRLKKLATRFVQLSTQPGYDIKTGAKSSARLAKLPRINIILKQDADLDYVNSSGLCTSASAEDAVALLLQFKPFHVYINGLLVMYNLTDYIFGTSSNPSGGVGDIAGDSILFRESVGLFGDINTDERVSYRYTTVTPELEPSVSMQDTSYNKGNILLKYSVATFNDIPSSAYVTDSDYLVSLGMPLRGYNKAIQVDLSTHIWNRHTDFALATENSNLRRITPLPHANTVGPYSYIGSLPSGLSLNTATGEVTGTTNAVGTVEVHVTDAYLEEQRLIITVSYDGTTYYYTYYYSPSYLDIYTHSYCPMDFKPAVNASFISMPFNTPGLSPLSKSIPVSLRNSALFTRIPESNIYTTLKSVVSVTPVLFNEFLKDTSVITYIEETLNIDTNLPVSETTKTVSQSYVTGDAWSFAGLTNFRASLPSITDLSTGIPLTTDALVMNKLYNTDILLVATYSTDAILLDGSDFKIDSKTHSIIFNMYSIISKLTSPRFDPIKVEDYYTQTLQIHILSVEKDAIDETFNIESTITRGTNISSTRKHEKFTRFRFVDNSILEALRNTQSIEPSYEVDTTSGELVEQYAVERGFNTQLPILYSRHTLFEEEINAVPVLNISYRQPRNESLWTILKPSPSIYPATNFIANFYNVESDVIPGATIPYSSIDMSSEAQVINRASSKWSTLVSYVPVNQKEYFLLSRNNTTNRTNVWTRGSALKSSLPYIGTSRAYVQPFRDDITIFNRTDYLPDYTTSSLYQNTSLGNHTYSTSVPVDMTSIHFSSTGTTANVAPTTNEFIYNIETLKTTISSTGVITYPLASINMYQYDSSFHSLQRNTYFTNNDSTVPFYSLYAGNIRFDEHPSSSLLFSSLSDGIDIGITGLTRQTKIVFGTDPILPAVPLDFYNTYITWREINTGSTIAIGIVPEVDYSLVRPNIRVLQNGLEIHASNTTWTLSDTPGNPTTINLLSDIIIEDTDIFNIEYETFGPAIVTDPSLVPQTLTSILDETTTITAITTSNQSTTTVNYNYLKVIPFSYAPVVEWTTDPGDFINTIPGSYSGWSEAIDNTTNRVAPEAIINRELATPNVTVSYVDSVGPVTTELVFRTDWVFRAIPATISYRIQLSSDVTNKLKVGDSIKVSYNKRP